MQFERSHGREWGCILDVLAASAAAGEESQPVQSMEQMGEKAGRHSPR